MKKWLSAAAVVVLCLALVIGVACGGGGEDEEGVKEVKFGAGLPLAGLWGAVIGLPAKDGVELANEKIGVFEVGGEQYRWKLYVEENYWTTAGGVASASKLIYENGVKIMHQSGTDAGRAAQSLCEGSGVLLDGSAGLGFLGPDKPHSFYFAPSYETHAPAFFHWLTEEHPEIKTAVAAATDDMLGHEFAHACKASAEYFGLDWLGTEYIPAGTVELYPIATKLMTKDPDLVIGSVLTMQPMLEMGWDGITAYTMWSSADADYVGWENVENGKYLLWLPNPYGEWLTQEVKDFAAEYDAKYGMEFTGGPFWAATILSVLTDALKKAGTTDDIDKIIAALETETFDTWIGPLKFGGEELVGINHLLLWPVIIADLRDQAYHVLTVVPADEAYELAVEVYK